MPPIQAPLRSEVKGLGVIPNLFAAILYGMGIVIKLVLLAVAGLYSIK